MKGGRCRFGNPRLLYAILSPTAGQVKFGMSALPAERMQELQWAHGHQLELLVAVRATVSDEKAIHRRLARHRLFGEWFEACDAVTEVIRELLNKGKSAPQEWLGRFMVVAGRNP